MSLYSFLEDKLGSFLAVPALIILICVAVRVAIVLIPIIFEILFKALVNKFGTERFKLKLQYKKDERQKAGDEFEEQVHSFFIHCFPLGMPAFYFKNVVIWNGDYPIETDGVIVSTKGIFAVEAKIKYGTDRYILDELYSENGTWAHSMNGPMGTLKNPLLQNKRHIETIRSAILPDKYKNDPIMNVFACFAYIKTNYLGKDIDTSSYGYNGCAYIEPENVLLCHPDKQLVAETNEMTKFIKRLPDRYTKKEYRELCKIFAKGQASDKLRFELYAYYHMKENRGKHDEIF